MRCVGEMSEREYVPRGPLQQFRYEELVGFQCCYCGEDKKSKLVARYEDDPTRRVCNGCYGNILAETPLMKKKVYPALRHAFRWPARAQSILLMAVTMPAG
jgi:hypothetical protein